MRILVLQLKRIGDLILTTPALDRLAAALPEAQITLAVHANSAPLLPAIPRLASGIVFGRGRAWTPWQQTLTGKWGAVLDFTGTDRSALAAALSRAPRRAAFEWVKKRWLRALAYGDFVDSPVRNFHTVDHYAHLLRALGVEAPEALPPRLLVPEDARARAHRLLVEGGVTGPFAILHPGAARLEKFWEPNRWVEVLRHLRENARLDCVITGGRSPEERAHVETILALAGRQGAPGAAGQLLNVAGTMSLVTLAALAAEARLVISCDTAMVHLAAAFQRPQIALFGPTDPFHWRPRHPRAVVFSAAQPDAPLTRFDPRAKGAPMDRLSTPPVIRATDWLCNHRPLP